MWFQVVNSPRIFQTPLVREPILSYEYTGVAIRIFDVFQQFS